MTVAMDAALGAREANLGRVLQIVHLDGPQSRAALTITGPVLEVTPADARLVTADGETATVGAVCTDAR
jgi:hypothetical protein